MEASAARPPLGRTDPATGGATEAAAARTGPSWIPANPAPLGLAGFGITTLVLSVMNANLVSFNKNLPVVLGLAIAYGGAAQFLAGMWEFRTGNTFGAVAFTSYGAFWISFYFLVQVQLPAIAKGGDAGHAIGLYLWAWGGFTAIMFLCSFAASRAVSFVLLALTVTYVLLAIGNSGGHTNIIHAGGYAGIVTAALALYTVCAEVMHAQYRRWVLPVNEPGRVVG
jgi:succinate-acetate transporter protein